MGQNDINVLVHTEPLTYSNLYIYVTAEQYPIKIKLVDNFYRDKKRIM